MPTRAKPAPKKKPAKPMAKTSAGSKRLAAAPAAVRKTAAASSPAAVRPVPAAKPARPAQMAAPMSGAQTKAAPPKPALRPLSAGQVATAQQAEERRKRAVGLAAEDPPGRKQEDVGRQDRGDRRSGEQRPTAGACEAASLH